MEDPDCKYWFETYLAFVFVSIQNEIVENIYGKKISIKELIEHYSGGLSEDLRIVGWDLFEYLKLNWGDDEEFYYAIQTNPESVFCNIKNYTPRT